MTLAIMILPLIMRTAEEALIWRFGSLPREARSVWAPDAARYSRIVLPAAGPASCRCYHLSIGRIVEQTMALIFTAGTMLGFPVCSSRPYAGHPMYALR